jgi:predicted transcriptional regulator
MLIRVPDEIKTWIEEKAAQDERSQTAVIVRALRAMMAMEQSTKAAG